jgi:hypothetical protein
MKTLAMACGLLLLAFDASAWGQIQIDVTTSRDEALKLAARLPRVDTDSVMCPPFDAEVRLNLAEGGYLVHFQFRRPDRIEALMRDLADGSPVVLYRGLKAMHFDASTPQFVVLPEHKLNFVLAPNDKGRIELGSRIGFGKDAPRRLLLDVAGIMQLSEGELLDRGSTEKVIRLERRREDEGKREEVEFRLDVEPPVCVLKSWTDHEQDPGVVLKLTIHTHDSKPLFAEPDLAEVRKILPVVEADADEAASNGVLGFAVKMKLIAEFYQSAFSHLGLRQPSARGEFKLPGLSPPDWDVVARNKKQLGPQLRDALHLGLLQWDDADSRPITPQMAADEIEVAR